MSRDLQTLRTEVRKWLAVDEKRLPDAQIDMMVNVVLTDISRRCDVSEFEGDTSFTFTTIRATDMDNEAWPLSLITGQYNYNTISQVLPSDFSRPHSVFWMDGNTPVYLEQISFEEFQDNFKSIDQGDPTHYALWGGKIYCAPVPNEDTEVYAYYYAHPPVHGEATGEVTTSAFLTKHFDLVLYGVMAESCRYLLEDQRFQMYTQAFESRLRRFFIQEARKHYAGLRPESKIP